MKYAIANKNRIVYSIRDTSDGFDPKKTLGEICIPIGDHHAVVAPHYVHDEASDTFSPREIDAELREEMIEAAKEHPDHTELHDAIRNARNYYDLPLKLQFDGGHVARCIGGKMRDEDHPPCLHLIRKS